MIRGHHLIIAAAVLLCTLTARAASDAPPAGIAQHANQLHGDELTDAQQASVNRGLAFLAAQQDADGSYRLGTSRHAGVTALAALAFMEAGNLPNRGTYGANVAGALRFVLASVQDSGLIVAEDTSVPMYGHGFATLFLGEVYGMTGDDAVKEKLQRAVSLIERSQSKQPGNAGGWRYQPVPLDADISVTICQIMALRAARDAGVRVDHPVMASALSYVQSCQNPDGGFTYSLAGGRSASGYGRSAAGVASMYYAGLFSGPDLTRGLNYLRRYIWKPDSPGPDLAEQDANYFYGNYYMGQAMFLAGGDYWTDWYPGVREKLIARQSPAGGWSGEAGSPSYCTSMALLVLQLPNRYLPVFNGKGPGD
jgi:hypothetical protein